MRVVVAVLLAVAAARAVNYCGAKVCGNSNAHTFCRYQAGPGAGCVGYMDARLTAEEKVRVLARLNRRRSEAASGRLRLPTAGNMLKLRWVEDLARLAQRWADQCRPPSSPDERDSCRDLFSISVGQCVASVVGEAPGLRVETMVDLWYMQSLHYKDNVTYYVVPMSSVNFYGDFAQMIWAQSYMVGCGRSRFMSQVRGRLRTVERLVCNVAPRGPVPGRPLWSPAAPAATCPPRSTPDPQLPALCNYQSDLDVSTDVDGTMTMEEHVLLNSVLEVENKESFNYLGGLDELYLTKLAIVTMDNKVTKPLPYSNTMQKRDILNNLGIDYDLNNIDISVINKEELENINATLIVNQESSAATPQVIIKRVKLIGRPKSYKIEDLTDTNIIEQSSPQEINTPVTSEQDFSKIDPDLYLDDETSEPDDATLITDKASFPSGNMTQIELNIESTKAYDNNVTEINITQNKFSNRDINLTRAVIRMEKLYNMTKSGNSSLAFPTKSDEDYLTDPETVRELQAALERMEQSLDQPPPPSPTAGKVRRELRDPPPIDNEVQSATEEDTPKPAQDSPEPPRKTADKGPMLNMVLKYIPYLKPYENQILGHGESSGSSVKIAQGLCSVGVALVCCIRF